MRLYAKCASSEGGRRVSKGSNDVLNIELYNGNNIQGLLTLNIYNNELIYSTFKVCEFIPVYREKLKVKTQQD